MRSARTPSPSWRSPAAPRRRPCVPGIRGCTATASPVPAACRRRHGFDLARPLARRPFQKSSHPRVHCAARRSRGASPPVSIWRDCPGRAVVARSCANHGGATAGLPARSVKLPRSHNTCFPMTFRTRFAPSPTGFLHIGGARTALYCWLEARHRGGQFILRIEDTDRERSTDIAVQAILDGMNWLGLDHDEGPFYQTLRMDRYRQVAEELVRAGKAYYAYETKDELDAMRSRQMEQNIKPRYAGAYRERNEPLRDDPNRVIRFRNPASGSVVFNDKVKGRIEWSNEELDDLVMVRSDGFPTYNFAVVVDDIDMRVSEAIRGDDHVNNTPRQINIYSALEADIPEFAHLPMILGPDGQKLSKRHGAVSVMQYRDDGFLPHAVLNYLVRLGWSHGDQEIYSIKQMIDLFDVADVNKAASRFDVEKLSWLNQHYIKTGDPEALAPELEWQLRQQGYDPAHGPRA